MPESSTWKAKHRECQAAVDAIHRAEEAKTEELRLIYERGVKRQEEITAQVAAERDAARREVERYRAAVASALEDLERRDELSALDTLRAALGV
jgi:hypothetical protein